MAPSGSMRAPVRIYADEGLLAAMDEAVADQLAGMARLPGLVDAALAMPDAHVGYGFPIGGVAAFDPDEGGVISAGGVGFDISCGVRTLLTGLSVEAVRARGEKLADALFARIPAGVGCTGPIKLSADDMEAMLRGGAAWAVDQGFGEEEDLARIESGGRMADADPDHVSPEAKRRQEAEMGTLGSGNHYLEVQAIEEIYDEATAKVFGLKPGEVVVSLHCGSRGLGHQVATDYAKRMRAAAAKHGLERSDPELACAPLRSEEGLRYAGAMHAAINCALANRQMLGHRVREVLAKLFPDARLRLLYDVSHNTCREEAHLVDGQPRRLFVHRKGATRALPPGHPELPEAFMPWGQPVLVGGSMGTASYILAGTTNPDHRAFHSACHGAGRSMSRSEAQRRWKGREVVDALTERGIRIRTHASKGVSEEAPGAYKDVDTVVDVTHRAGLARKVARLTPLICVKG